MAFLGIDPQGIINSIGSAYKALVPGQPMDQGFGPAQQNVGGFAPAVVTAGGFAPAVVGGSGFQPGRMGDGGFQPATMGQGGFQPSGILGGGFQPGDISGGGFRPSLYGPNTPKTPIASASAGPGGGMSFSGPATADDNKGITAEQIDNFIRSKFPNSPLAGQGAYILAQANAKGVSVPLVLGIGWKESGMGTNVGAGNIFGITDPTRDEGPGGKRAFQSYGNVQAEIDAAINNLATPTYKGKSAADQIGIWYTGKPGDPNATDLAGNGTVAEYLNNFIAPAYRGLGVGTDLHAPGVRAPAGSKGMNAIAGGAAWSDMQEFGPTEYSAQHPETYAYASAYGATGHTGIDMAMPEGTRAYSPVGGTVVTAGGTNYFTYNGRQGVPGEGELKIQLDNGDQIILGHMQHINLRPGQRINAGDFVGLSGGSDGAHIHLEVRRVDKNLPSGYRIVDPRSYFGG